jgi:hypothetical protein
MSKKSWKILIAKTVENEPPFADGGGRIRLLTPCSKLQVIRMAIIFRCPYNTTKGRK